MDCRASLRWLAMTGVRPLPTRNARPAVGHQPSATTTTARHPQRPAYDPPPRLATACHGLPQPPVTTGRRQAVAGTGLTAAG